MRARRSASGPSRLSDHEGSVLALIARSQPVSAYQLMRIFSESPVTHINKSKGTIYPIVRRLKERGLLASRQVSNDGRRTELLSCNAKGKRELKDWIETVEPDHIILDDMLRAKIASFDLLSADEKREWVSRARALTMLKREELERYGVALKMPFQDVIWQNILEGLDARLRWFDAIEGAIDDQS